MWGAWCNLIFLFFASSVTSAKPPNVLIFLADDLGSADLGCFGNKTMKTPNIDRLAEEGARLLHDVHPDAICTPNRAALLTGRYPIRSGLGSSTLFRVFSYSSVPGGLPQNETTFAEIASNAGYKTGNDRGGRWGLLYCENVSGHFSYGISVISFLSLDQMETQVDASFKM